MFLYNPRSDSPLKSMFFNTFSPAILAKLHFSRQRYYKKCTYARKRTFFLEKKIDLSIYWSITYSLGGSLLTRECIGDTSMSKLCLTLKKMWVSAVWAAFRERIFEVGEPLYGARSVSSKVLLFSHIRKSTRVFFLEKRQKSYIYQTILCYYGFITNIFANYP